jgi:type III secretory pathway lipoprotein EscJ
LTIDDLFDSLISLLGSFTLGAPFMVSLIPNQSGLLIGIHRLVVDAVGDVSNPETISIMVSPESNQDDHDITEASEHKGLRTVAAIIGAIG